MLQAKKQYIYLIAAAMSLIMAGCRHETPRDEAPHWTAKANQIIDPNWSVNEQSVDITSSMNVIAAVEGAQISDKLSAWSDDVCIGACQPVETKFGLRFYLCIYQPAAPNKPITLAYYCASEHNVIYWTERLEFTNDAVLGLASDPYVLSHMEACRTVYPAGMAYFVACDEISNQDELALFSGNECRQLLPLTDGHYTVKVGLQAEREEMYVRYYSDILGKIFTSPKFTLHMDTTETFYFDFKSNK